MADNDLHLDVFLDHSEFHQNGETTIFQEGRQSSAAQNRYSIVTNKLANGYLEDIYNTCAEIDTSIIDTKVKSVLTDLVNGVTSEVGRALVGLAFLQTTIKSIVPEQSIRLHKGSTRNGSFSWKEGISMRTIDSNYVTPFLREKGLLNINKYGIMMTRSLAENYPYSQLYKAEMRGPFDKWIKVVDILEGNTVSPVAILAYIMSLLINKSEKFEELAENAISKLNQYRDHSFAQIEALLIDFFTTTQYSARAFEVVIHSFMQAYKQNYLTDYDVVPMSQMRSANKKHGNVGDIELKDGRIIIEAWDAKYGKSYLYDELDELKDKLLETPGTQIAGFIVNDHLDIRPDITRKATDVSILTQTDIKLFTFKDWVKYELDGTNVNLNKFGRDWLEATVETFARRRLDIAPLDEPCDEWLIDLSRLLR